MPKRKSISYDHPLAIRITENMYQQLKSKADFTQLTVTEYIRSILRKELKEQNEIQEKYGYNPAKRVLSE